MHKTIFSKLMVAFIKNFKETINFIANLFMGKFETELKNIWCIPQKFRLDTSI